MMDRFHLLLQTLADKKLTLGSVESLTGGKFAAKATSYPGASLVYKGSLITYAVEEKENLAKVPARLIERFGVVSEPVAKAMASGGKNALNVDVCLSCTGNAGPTAEPGKAQVGDVYVSVAYNKATWTLGFHFGSKASREEIRDKTIDAMVELALSLFPCDKLDDEEK